MFVNRKEYDALVREVRALRASQKDSYKSVITRVKSIEEHVGANRSYHPYSLDRLFDVFYSGGPGSREAKPFNLTQKVNAIMEHLGLREEVSAETKLVKKSASKSKPKKSTTATEAAALIKSKKETK